MIFLFEQFAYSIDFLEKVLPQKEKDSYWDLPKGFVQKESNGLRKLDGVGYLYNANSKYAAEEKNISHKIVFVLPKVFLEEHQENNNKIIKAFGQIISKGRNFEFDDSTKEIPKEFLSNLSLWVCSSIGKYRLSNPADNSIDVPEAPDVRHFDSDKATPTLIDVMNAMKSFYAENQNLFVFTAKNKHSGNNRIDWRRTVSRTQPFLQDGTPIYINLENKKKVIDVDDRLLVLYFSAMHYIEETFGFKMPHSEFYAPMRVNEFRRLLGHRGLVELRRIKHKYFADKFLRLYNIVKTFFEWGGNFSANDYRSEYLLTIKYNNVFEAMIDKLVGDELPKGMKYLKDQKDGKIIDHLYKDHQLIFADEKQKIWFIGDSKYYSEGKKIEGSSIYKQFTYAKNIIQYNISELLDSGKNDKDYNGLRYRDWLTEGYSVTPNFFIRGFLPKSDKDPSKKEQQFREPYFRTEYTDKQLIDNEEDSDSYQLIDDEGNLIDSNKNRSLWDLRNRHFKNRLFDRDTLLLQVYNVNFLYVLKAYTSKHSGLREEFKSKARKLFRDNFLDLLDKKYVFWAVWPQKESFDKAHNYAEAEEMFVNKHFRTLVGKIFKPVDLKCLILALERDFRNSTDSSKCYEEDIFDKIKSDCVYFHVTPTDIFPINTANLPEATFADNEIEKFDEQLYAYSVKRDVFESKKIGEKYRLPGNINGRKLTGAVLGDCNLERIGIQKSPLDEYYYLPCKED